MAFAAVLFALPFAFASAVVLAVLHGLGLTETALLYVLAGSGGMASFLIAASVSEAVDRT
ncbi:hypothetical protein GQ651_14685 [Alphaproteobacteria bacterium GH1-50]|uniref:Uncharacterized protein n=1 Tax=Kangsaoukella pontilimi TaxID=2691042 RepID=A0A7C9MEW1_9RHOB|nr:hypothetical protein [Kangsaoukella pontilimi]MXQ09091.1 hypothetical protein [Kangsaoukella pontilimi]